MYVLGVVHTTLAPSDDKTPSKYATAEPTSASPACPSEHLGVVYDGY
jgi:hypothetical protein